jgi:peptidyl-prolyl cis-trans isomerase B (cyclophilin B)
MVTVGGVFLVVLLLVLGLTWGRDLLDSEPAAKVSPSASPSASPQPVACGATAPPAAKKQTFGKEPPLTLDTKKTYTAHMKTSCGMINIELFDDKAPHTVNSFYFLATKNYYDGTFCHRETNSPTLTVLQCGDPSGDGTGGPGYTIAEENLAGAKYTRGLVAMAKTSAPHSTGSQFFLIDKDSQLPAEYTVVGRMDAAGLAVLDKIMALGATPKEDGAPNQKVYVEDFTITAA